MVDLKRRQGDIHNCAIEECYGHPLEAHHRLQSWLQFELELSGALPTADAAGVYMDEV